MVPRDNQKVLHAIEESKESVQPPDTGPEFVELQVNLDADEEEKGSEKVNSDSEKLFKKPKKSPSTVYINQSFGHIPNLS